MNNKNKIKPEEYVEGETTITQGNEGVLESINSEELLKETHEVVKEFVSAKQQILADERKMRAIGSALLTQKDHLDDIKEGQISHQDSTSQQLEEIAKSQEHVSDDVANLLTSTKGVESLQDEQTKLIHTLSAFKEEHSKLADKTKEEAEASILALESIHHMVEQVLNEVGNMDLHDRISGLTNGIQNVQEMLLDIKEEHQITRAKNSQEMGELVQQVGQFRKEVSDKGLVQKLYSIQQAADISDQKVMDLSYKIDLFIEEYELSKDSHNVHLEDLFEKVDKPELMDESEDTLMIDVEVDHFIEEEETTKEIEDEVEKVHEPVSEPAIYSNEPPHPPRKEAQKKKGLFDKLFGGW